MRRRFQAYVVALVALSGVAHAQMLTSPPPNLRWVQFSDSDVRLLDWDTVSSITFDKAANNVRLTGPAETSGTISDGAMIERFRRAIAAEPNRWVRSRTKQGGSWVETRVAETFVDIFHVRQIAIVRPIDVGGVESYQLASTRDGPLGLVVDASEKARVKALWSGHWP